MTRRVFATVTRGMTDKTAVCVFPWELDLLGHIHGDQVEQVSIDQMCSMQGAVKVEKVKLKHTDQHAPDLRAQFEAMCYVDPDEDPANDPQSEYNRMAEKYGMDKDFPMPVVERIFGQFGSGGFEARVKLAAKDSMPKPKVLQEGEDPERAPVDMTVGELRKVLTSRGIKWTPREGHEQLVHKLESALAAA